MLYRKLIAALTALACWLLCAFSVMAEEPPSVSARSAILVDATSGAVLFEHNAHEPLPMASTTKLMTALVAVERLDWDAEITIPDEAVYVEGSSMGLCGGDVLTVGDLLTGLLLVSGNDAANAVAMLCCGSLPDFAAAMNARAAAIGMTDTIFVTPSGLDAENHHTTAYDMALLAREVLRQPRLSAVCAMKTATVAVNGINRTLTNHNRLLSMYADCIGLKNGYTQKSGRCLVSAARRGGGTLIVVTLNGGDYWNDHIRLYDYGFAQLREVMLPSPSLLPLPVSGGDLAMVSLSVLPPTLTLPPSVEEQITTRVVCPPFVWAPLETGRTVGAVYWEYEGAVLASAPLKVNETAVARPVAGTAERIARLFLACLRALLSQP